jgi:Lon protease-like protein
MVDICIFPIPDCVTFPGTISPLHVFEPRYRAMIRHCLDNQQLVAICHTRKMIHPGKNHQTREEALSSNQATYKPFDVFSAGLCEFIETTTDGRLYLNVHIQQRYQAVQEKQTLPYMIYECELFSDTRPDAGEQQQNRELQEKIVHRLSALAFKAPVLQAGFKADEWLQKSTTDFSFELFGMISFGSENQQQILEMNSIRQRLQRALELLNQVTL